MHKRRLAVLAVSAMMLTSFSFPGRSVQASLRTSGLRSVQQTSRQVQYLSPFHEGGCNKQDSLAYDPADDYRRSSSKKSGDKIAQGLAAPT